MLNISVIISTFNGQHLLKKNLPAVLASARNEDELLIIDDASQDSTIDYLCRIFKLKEQKKPNLSDNYGKYRLFQNFYSLSQKRVAISLIINQRNLRFARSCNRAANIARGDLLWLLNNDVRVDKNCLAILTKQFADQNDDQKLFAVGALEYEGNDTQAPKAGKNRLWFEKGLFIHAKAKDFDFGATAWASGGSGLFDRQKWLKLGGFDTKFYPAYWEDVDLSFRAKKHGWRVVFEPKAVVFHQHESTNASVFGTQAIKTISYRHQCYFTRKNGDFWQKLSYYLWRPYWWTKFS